MKAKLFEYLLTQDMSVTGAHELCEKILLGESLNDPISEIIKNAFESSDNGADLEAMEQDIDYAISMLNRVKIKINEQ